MFFVIVVCTILFVRSLQSDSQNDPQSAVGCLVQAVFWELFFLVRHGSFGTNKVSLSNDCHFCSRATSRLKSRYVAKNTVHEGD